MKRDHEVMFKAKLNDPAITIEKKAFYVQRMTDAELRNDGVISKMTLETIADALINNKINQGVLTSANVQSDVLNNILSFVQEKQGPKEQKVEQKAEQKAEQKEEQKVEQKAEEDSYIEIRKEIWKGELEKDKEQITQFIKPISLKKSYELTQNIESELKELNTEPLTETKIEHAVRTAYSIEAVIEDAKHVRNKTFGEDFKMAFNHVTERFAPTFAPIIKFFIPNAFIKQMVASELSSAPSGLVRSGQTDIKISCNNQQNVEAIDPAECYKVLTNLNAYENYACTCEVGGEGGVSIVVEHPADYSL